MWSILSIVLGEKIFCDRFLRAIVVTCLVMSLWFHSKIENNLAVGGGQLGVGGTSETAGID